jgi:hypothetical protein
VSQENVEIVRRFIAAWSAHDREEMLRYLHPDAVFHSAITNVVDEYIDVDESTVVTLHRVFATGRTSGIQTIRELGGVLELRDGLVIRQWIYLDPAEALAAAGVER